jgi:hypothetical protein
MIISLVLLSGMLPRGRVPLGKPAVWVSFSHS